MFAVSGRPVSVVAEDLTGPSFARRSAAERSVEGVDEPFYVMDVGSVVRQHRRWLRLMPRVQPFYAVKCNNDPVLLSLLARLGVNFDCASKGEIEAVLGLGVSPDRIIYANPCKTASYVKHARSRNVPLMTFDNEEELEKIRRFYPEAEMVLRIAVSDPTAVCQLNLKFGAEPVERAPELLRAAADAGVKVVGVSFHVGSGCRDPTAFALGVEHARRLLDLAEGLGHPVRLLDLGGGYPGVEGAGPTFEALAEVVNQALDLHFPVGCGVEIVAEPGRYYAAAAYTLCVNVIAKTRVAGDKITKRAEDAGEDAFMYYVNDGVYGSFNCVLYDHAQPIPQVLLPESDIERKLHWSNVWGPTCDSMDLIASGWRLPRLDVGDWVMFEGMGAYTLAAGSEFNGFPRPVVSYIITEADCVELRQLLLERGQETLLGGQEERGDDEETASTVSSASYPDSEDLEAFTLEEGERRTCAIKC